MDRRSNRRRLHSRPDNGIYDILILSGMDIPESVDTQKKAQENHSKMAETPVPSLILSLSVSTIFTMLVATSYNIVDTYFVSDLGESSVAAVGIMFSVMALIQAVGYTWGMGAGSEIARLLGKQKKREAEQTLANLKAVLDAAGLSISDIAKTTVFVTNLDDFDAFNAVYAAFMGSHRPARVLVEVSNIAHGCLLEMDAVCYKD